MGLAYLRSDADRAMGIGMGRVLAREAAGCGRDMALALRTAQGASKMTASYWMGRRFLGAAGRPLADDTPLSLSFLTPRRPARVRIRRNQSDLLILWQVFLKRFYELGVHYRLEEDIDTLDTIVDLGGNTGLAASYFTARYRPRTLLSVEPIPQNLAVLRHNAVLSGLDWKIEPAAVTGESGMAEFTVSAFWDTCTAVPAVADLRRTRPYRLENVLARPNVRVPALTVDELLAKHNIDHIDLLKVDVEGSEVDVFRQVEPWMDRVERIVLEVHDKYIDGDVVRKTMCTAGFRQVPPRVPEPAGFNPVELYVKS
ncbi:FkbM family methyltransferase [Streptomyces sp. TLI_55]|uniref:FkbM family methyltransferase n=1 Tax=Streptomyces sp. TLI_55 TaxID=1938861 RepID=UPI000BC88564|nr:FkbM family methyltransferase [Streptomyces sp. TLI_55]SNX88558.1 FkbM family methyltransferase [Streptomyces sp. TLI_55]